MIELSKNLDSNLDNSQALVQRLTINKPFFQIPEIIITGFNNQEIESQLNLDDFNSQLASTKEPQLLSSAQLHRVLSNLAICAIELNNNSEQSFYYLTEQAKAKNHQLCQAEVPELNLEDFPLIAKAKGKLTDATAGAKVDLYNAQAQKIYSIKFTFLAVNKSAFEQKYVDYLVTKVATTDDKSMPRQLPQLDEFIYTPPAHAAALFGPIDQKFCQGYIDNYNPIPNDILVRQSIELALQWLEIQRPTDHHNYNILKYQLINSELAFSHDELSITCCQLHSENADDEMTLSILIYVRAQAISEMEVTLVK